MANEWTKFVFSFPQFVWVHGILFIIFYEFKAFMGIDIITKKSFFGCCE